MKIKNVLWPTDFSENASKALPFVMSLSEKYQAQIHVVYVLEEAGHYGVWYGEYSPSDLDRIRQLDREMAEKRLNEICETHLKGCPLFVKHIAVGDPASEILKMIDSEKIDMVVLASHGLKGRFHFGSVAEKVVKHATVPVITIPIGSRPSA